MNVLLYVMTILMLLALMTYARLEMFRDTTGMQLIFEYYMKNKEREPVNKTEVDWYYIKRASKKTAPAGKQNENEDKKKQAPGSSRISFYYFVNQQGREAAMTQYSMVLPLAKRLVSALYGDAKFYQEALEKRPTLLDDLFAAIIVATDKLKDKDKLKKTEELANLDLGDSQLNEVFAKMLKGVPDFKQEGNKPSEEAEFSALTSDEDEGVVEVKTPSASQQEQPQDKKNSPVTKGYPSLYDFITIRNTKGIRLFLASRPLLMAIYGDPAIVNSVIAFRNELHNRVRAGLNTQEATKTFQAEIQGYRYEGLDPSLLDFSVTKTNPGDYE